MKKLVIIFALLLLAVGCDNTIVGQSTEMPSSTSTITTPKISNFSPGVGSVPGMGSVEPSATSSPQTSLSTNNQTNQQIKNLQNEVNQLKKQQSSPTPVQNNPSPTPTPSQPVTPSTPAQPDLPTIISEWQSRVAIVICTFADSSSLQGSALLDIVSGYGTVAVTNNHMLIDANGITPPTTCYIADNIGARTVGDVGGVQQGVISKVFFQPTAGIDMAYIKLSNPFTATDNWAFDSAVLPQGKVCNQNDVALGDQIIVLGYPVDGSKTTVTATQGIVAGFNGNYIVTDAKIDHGNSGGAAILVKDDCYLGIPSAAVVGSIESYGQILKSNFVFGN